MKHIYLFLLMSFQVLGADQWFCTEQASQRKSSTIEACGLGLGEDENKARTEAFDHAKAEFIRICSLSDDCKSHEISVRPGRTACDWKNPGYQCSRMIVFEIGEKTTTIQSLESHDTPEEIKPFSYDEIKSLPKIKKGLKLSQVLRLFGKPQNIEKNPYLNETTITFDHAVFCNDLPACFVQMKNGLVIGYSYFKPEYTEDLK